MVFGERGQGTDLPEVVAHGEGEHEVSVGQPLHQRRCAEPVRTVVGEVGFSAREEPGNRRLQVVVHPQAAHRVVNVAG